MTTQIRTWSDRIWDIVPGSHSDCWPSSLKVPHMEAEIAELRAALADRAERAAPQGHDALAKALIRHANILRDCGRLVSKSGDAERNLRVAAALLAPNPSSGAEGSKP